jgi:DNA mismatch repair protein MutS
MFEVKDDHLRKEISDMQLEGLTPLDALNKLNELQKKIKDEK